MKRLTLRFTGPLEVDIAEERLPLPGRDQVLVQTLISGVSAGTELLVYRNQWPPDVPVDETIPALEGRFAYPLSYGYAAVGRVVEAGSTDLAPWLDRTVFAFNPHQTHFLADPKDLIPVPPSLTPEEAVFLPNMETAVCLLMDGSPAVGECVVVFGQGIVGLLTVSLLARLPLGCLVTVDGFKLRREKSVSLGAGASLDASSRGLISALLGLCVEGGSSDGADLAYEISGNPKALDSAISVAGFCGRIVVGSWYGAKRADLDLGSRFHRSRMRLIGSQVSTVAPELSGRWSKGRRLAVALKLLEEVRPAHLVTHRFALTQAEDAYRLLHKHPEEAIQVIFEYEDRS